MSLLEGIKKGQASEIGSLSEQVTRIGFEPMTPSLEGWCSIQLSYRAGSPFFLTDGKGKKIFDTVTHYLSYFVSNCGASPSLSMVTGITSRW